MTTVGIVGCGTIGSQLAKAIEHHHRSQARIVALTDRSHGNARRLQQALHNHPPIVSLSELIHRSQLVIETATAAIAAHVATLALKRHRQVLIMSVGGLLLHPATWLRAAARTRGRLYVPSGALCGLDGAKALAVGAIRRIRLTTRKPPRALASAPFVIKRGLDLRRLRRPTTLFEGSPQQAVKAFPQNLNVGAALVLACSAPRAHPNGHGQPQGTSTRQAMARATVRIVADPTITRNIHEVEIEGDCARIRCEVESAPSATNPKTSELAIRSALATINQLFGTVRIGT